MGKKTIGPLTPSMCRLSRLSTQFVGREMTRIGFGPGQFFLLSELFLREGQSQDELSGKVGVDKSNTSRALGRLEKYGLVQRAADPENHKEKRVYLTEKAREIESVFRNIQKDWNSALLDGFSEEEIQFLSSALIRMIENAQAVIQKKNSNPKTEARRIKTMTLTDIISSDKCAEFADKLFHIYGLNCSVYDSSGTIVSGKPNWSNRLCPMIKSNPESLATICAPSNQHFMAEVKQSGKALVGECDAGFRKIAVPIIVNGQFLGAAGGCGLLCENEEIETFLIEKLLKIDEQEITDLYKGTSIMTEEEGYRMSESIEKQIAGFIKGSL